MASGAHQAALSFCILWTGKKTQRESFWVEMRTDTTHQLLPWEKQPQLGNKWFNLLQILTGVKQQEIKMKPTLLPGSASLPTLPPPPQEHRDMGDGGLWSGHTHTVPLLQSGLLPGESSPQTPRVSFPQSQVCIAAFNPFWITKHK